MAVLLYFIAGAVEVYLEMQRNTAAIYLIKPLLMPLLLTVYVLSVKSRDISYIAALVFSWIANIFFISPDYASIFTGAMFFFVFRVLTIYIVFKRSGPPKLYSLLFCLRVPCLAHPPPHRRRPLDLYRAVRAHYVPWRPLIGKLHHGKQPGEFDAAWLDAPVCSHAIHICGKGFLHTGRVLPCPCNGIVRSGAISVFKILAPVGESQIPVIVAR